MSYIVYGGDFDIMELPYTVLIIAVAFLFLLIVFLLIGKDDVRTKPQKNKSMKYSGFVRGADGKITEYDNKPTPSSPLPHVYPTITTDNITEKKLSAYRIAGVDEVYFYKNNNICKKCGSNLINKDGKYYCPNCKENFDIG